MSQNTKSGKGYFFGFLAGGTVGAVVALLTTPKSGKKLRKKIKKKSDEYFDEVDKYLAETKQNTGKLIDESRKKLATMLHDLKSKPEALYKGAEKAFKNVKGETIEASNSVKKKAEAEKEKLKSSVKA